YIGQVAPERRRKKVFVVQIRSEVFQLLAKWVSKEISQQRPPKQGNSSGPVCIWQTFDRSKFDKAVESGWRIPELVKANLAPMRVAGDVRVQMAKQFVDLVALIARPEIFQLAVGELHVEKRITTFIGTRRLGRNPDVTAGKQIRERRMMLPVAQNRCQPSRPREKWILINRDPTE